MTDTQAGTPAEVQGTARETYRQSVAAEMPLSGEALGKMFGRSGRWGRDRISEVRAEDTPAELPVFGSGSGNAQVSEAVASLSPEVAAQRLPVAEAVAAGGMPVAEVAATRNASGKGYALVALLAGIGVSIAGNVMSVRQESAEPAAWAVAAFWPFAVYLAIEVITRVQWPEKGRREWWQTLVRFVGAGAVGLVAAIVSYRHMAHLLASWGEDGISVTLGPLAVDGLVAVAATALYVIKHDKEAQK